MQPASTNRSDVVHIEGGRHLRYIARFSIAI
jgi:hypothetical protein